MKNKKILIIIGVTLVLVATAYGLTSKSGRELNYDLKTPKTGEIEFSNLLDQESRQEVFTRLKRAGLRESDIDLFMANVKEYNESIDNISLVSGFKKHRGYEPDYDMVEISQKLEKNGDFIGHNCRMTTLLLMDSLLSVGNTEGLNDDNLFMDYDAMKYDDFNWESYLKKFKALYSSVRAEKTKDLTVHLKEIDEEFKKRDISYKDGKLSQISVVFHSELDDILFIGHTALLLDDEEGLLLLEKLSFQEPYQALKFDNRREVNDYLMSKYDLSYGQPEAKPFILENTKLMDMYRPNLDNLQDIK